MSDVELKLAAAMHAAMDNEVAPPDELIRKVLRRHRQYVARLVGATVLAILAIVVPTAIGLSGSTSASRPSGPGHTPPPATELPTRISGLPMPAGTNFEFLVPTPRGAAWYSTATHRSTPVGGLPVTFGGYQFEWVQGGWVAWPMAYSSPCPVNECAGPPTTFYFIANGARTAVRIGSAYDGDGGVHPGTDPGTVWLHTYSAVTSLLTGSSFAQLATTSGTPLGPRYRLPANSLLGSGVGGYLMLDDNTDEVRMELWDPATGQVLAHFENVVAEGPDQVIWTNGCQQCRLEVMNVSTGKTLTTSIPGNGPGDVNVALSDDGRLLAAQLPTGGIAVLDTETGAMTRIPGTAVSYAAFEHLAWLPGSHRLVIGAGPNSSFGPYQLAYWQPGDTRIYVTTTRNPGDLTAVEAGLLG